MPKFEDYFDDLKQNIVDLANDNWYEIKDALIYDGTEFLFAIEDDLKKWTILLADNSLSQKDFEFLVKQKKDLAEMKMLKDLGLAKAQLDKLVNDIIDTVITKSISLII